MILILVRFLFAPSLRIHVCFTRIIDFQTISPLLRAAAVSEVVTTALILGHSFVKRLKRDLHQGFDSRASCDFNLLGTASVRLHGVGGRTVQTLPANDLHVVREVLTIFRNFHQEGLLCYRRSGVSVSQQFFSSRDQRLLCHPMWHLLPTCHVVLA